MRTTTRPRRNADDAPPPAPPPPAPTVPLPTFTPPETAATAVAADPDPEDQVQTTGPTLRGGGGHPYGAVGSAATIPTRTDTYSDSPTSAGLTSGGPHRAETARNAGILLAGVLTIAAGAAAVMLARVGRQLRRPTRDETRAVARPLARILLRHLPADVVTADLADLGEAGAAVSEWVTAGPVAPRVHPVRHIGMPDHDDDGGQAGEDNAPVTPAAPTAAEIWHAATNDNIYPTALTAPTGPRPEVSYQQ